MKGPCTQFLWILTADSMVIKQCHCLSHTHVWTMESSYFDHRHKVQDLVTSLNHRWTGRALSFLENAGVLANTLLINYKQDLLVYFSLPLCLSLSLSLCLCMCVQGPIHTEEGARFPRAGVTGWYGCWELNSSSPREQWMLLTTEPSLHSIYGAELKT